jgi:pimeloyl-ACP methyl ester carboxylesterase
MNILKKWLKRIGKILLLLIVVAIIIGIIYEQVSRQKNKKYEESRTGSFVDVGGHKLYYYSKGEGKPTVVFESGFPGSHIGWSYSELFKEISQYATAVCYNRAGILWSERGSKPKTSENISDDLYRLLEKGGFEKPYIIVGHSAAGIFVRPFVEKHESDLIGVILLDPSHPDQSYAAPNDIK